MYRRFYSGIVVGVAPQLDEGDKKMVFQMIKKLLTNQKFKVFFQENVGK